jgi:hydroxymethylbilane synthase
MENNTKIRIGTRGSKLALWQANFISEQIGRDKTEIIIIKTVGDRDLNITFDKIEGKGFFTKEIEEALLNKKIDLAVHSFKDLPTDNPVGLKIAVIPERGNFRDALLIRPESYDESEKFKVKKGAIVGTSSIRRFTQLKNFDNSLKIEPLRGNINTRVKKILEGKYDAIVMASAGIERINLNIENLIRYELPLENFIPAPAQGALALQIRDDDTDTFNAIKNINHTETEKLVSAERSFLNHFGGGCHVPIGAYATVIDDKIKLQGVILSRDGDQKFSHTLTGDDPIKLGSDLAILLKGKGADKIL